MKTQQILSVFMKFESVATPEMFNNIFDKSVATHLWNKFTFKHGHNLTSFYRSLDDANQKAINNHFDRIILTNKLSNLKTFKPSNL